MQFKRAGWAASDLQAPLILRTTWGEFADKMRETVDVDMGREHFTLADHGAPTEPDHSAFWEYIDDPVDELPTDRSQCIENYSTIPMKST